MADIAFLLIIFFLTTTVFSEERGLQMNLGGVRAAEAVVARDNILTIHVRADGVVLVRMQGELHERVIGSHELGEILLSESEADPEIIAAVKVEEKAGYQDLIGVLDLLKLAGVRRVSIQPWVG